jgi:hypothetical protein
MHRRPTTGFFDLNEGAPPGIHSRWQTQPTPDADMLREEVLPGWPECRPAGVIFNFEDCVMAIRERGFIHYDDFVDNKGRVLKKNMNNVINNYANPAFVQLIPLLIKHKIPISIISRSDPKFFESRDDARRMLSGSGMMFVVLQSILDRAMPGVGTDHLFAEAQLTLIDGDPVFEGIHGALDVKTTHLETALEGFALFGVDLKAAAPTQFMYFENNYADAKHGRDYFGFTTVQVDSTSTGMTLGDYKQACTDMLIDTAKWRWLESLAVGAEQVRLRRIAEAEAILGRGYRINLGEVPEASSGMAREAARDKGPIGRWGAIVADIVDDDSDEDNDEWDEFLDANDFARGALAAETAMQPGAGPPIEPKGYVGEVLGFFARALHSGTEEEDDWGTDEEEDEDAEDEDAEDEDAKYEELPMAG